MTVQAETQLELMVLSEESKVTARTEETALDTNQDVADTSSPAVSGGWGSRNRCLDKVIETLNAKYLSLGT